MVELRGFEPDQAYILAKVASILGSQPAAEVPKIDPDQCLVPPIDEHFVCQVCTFIVQDPQQCGECETLNCAKCVASWLSKSKDCPNCRK
jgi:hypothetical protein